MVSRNIQVVDNNDNRGGESRGFTSKVIQINVEIELIDSRTITETTFVLENGFMITLKEIKTEV